MPSAYTLSVAHSDPADLATAISSLHLFRSLGSSICIGLSAATVQQVLRSQLRRRLEDRGADLIDNLIQRTAQSLSDIDDLSPELQIIVRKSYETAVEWSLVVCLCFAALAFFSSLSIKEKRLAATD